MLVLGAGNVLGGDLKDGETNNSCKQVEDYYKTFKNHRNFTSELQWLPKKLVYSPDYTQ